MKSGECNANAMPYSYKIRDVGVTSRTGSVLWYEFVGVALPVPEPGSQVIERQVSPSCLSHSRAQVPTGKARILKVQGA